MKLSQAFVILVEDCSNTDAIRKCIYHIVQQSPEEAKKAATFFDADYESPSSAKNCEDEELPFIRILLSNRHTEMFQTVFARTNAVVYPGVLSRLTVLPNWLGYKIYSVHRCSALTLHYTRMVLHGSLDAVSRKYTDDTHL